MIGWAYSQGTENLRQLFKDYGVQMSLPIEILRNKLFIKFFKTIKMFT